MQGLKKASELFQFVGKPTDTQDIVQGINQNQQVFCFNQKNAYEKL